MMIIPLFTSKMYDIAVSFLYGEHVVRFPSGWCFLHCGHGLDFDIN